MISQLGIAFFGVIAIWLSQDTRYNSRKWSSVFGLIGQPFWFYSAWTTQQWGIFVLSILYTWVWLVGFRNYWLKK